MTYKRFYLGKLNAHLLKDIDAEHKIKMKFLMEQINQVNWTKKQKRIQKSSIISTIALYKCFIDKGISKKEAKELVKEYSFCNAEKKHKLLKAFFYIPGFFGCFRICMKKGMSGNEIWKSKVLSDNGKCLRIDVFKCLWADTCEFFACAELCEIFCRCDHIAFGNIKGFVFERSQTLGMKGQKCDFCFINEKGKK